MRQYTVHVQVSIPESSLWFPDGGDMELRELVVKIAVTGALDCLSDWQVSKVQVGEKILAPAK